MQPVNQFMLAVAVLWVLFTCYGVMMLLPPMDRRLRAWDMKLKGSKVPLPSPNRPQRVVFLLLASLMTTVAFAAAFDRDLKETIGISSGTACWLMTLLPALYFGLGLLNKLQKNREQPKA
jgi:hypothetical protein